MFQFTPGCCCGDTGVACIIYETNFTVSDTTTVPDATELVGDWEIISNVLHPDHAASDQRIRFDTASSDLDVWTCATVTGQSGDRVGVCLFLDADGDSFVEATMEFGSTTSGRLNMNRFDNGSLTWTHNISSSPQCGTNEYDFSPGATTYRIALRHRTVHGGSLWTLYLYLGTGANLAFGEPAIDQADYVVEYFDSAGVGAITSFTAGCVTGTDAITATFDSFLFYHLYADCLCQIVLDNPALYRNYDCDHVGMKFEEETGDWDLEVLPDALAPMFNPNAAAIVTYADPATLLTRDILRGDDPAHLCYFTYGSPSTSVDGLRFRYVWDWQDDDNYWCIEWEFGAAPNPSEECPDAVRIIERSGGAETTHEEVDGFANRYYENWAGGPAQFATFVRVSSDGYIAADISHDGNCAACETTPDSGITQIASGPHTFTGGGRQGWVVMDNPNGFLIGGYALWDAVGTCVETGAGTTCGEGAEDPEEPDPDTFTCCDEFDAIDRDSTVELTVSGLNPIVDCLGDPCAGDLVTFITDLNSTHTLTCIGANEDIAIFTLQTELDPPCETTASSIAMRITLWIIHEGTDQCNAYVEFWAGSTCVFWLKSTFPKDDGESCDGFSMMETEEFGTSAEDCCIDYSGVGASLDFNV